MVSPIDDVAFLARSETRVGVLRAVDERPRDRRELASVTDTPRSTLGRTLGELEERDWIERDGRAYEATTAGSLVVEQFVPLLRTMGVLQTLGDAAERLPIEGTGLDVTHLADAEFITPTGRDPTAPFEYGVARLRGADCFRCLARAAPRQYVRAIYEGAVEGGLSVECVLGDAYLEGLRDEPAVRDRWDEVASGSSVVRRSKEQLPGVVLVVDETVHLWLCDDEGETQGLLESTDPSALTWANEAIDAYLERAEPIDSLAADSGGVA